MPSPPHGNSGGGSGGSPGPAIKREGAGGGSVEAKNKNRQKLCSVYENMKSVLMTKHRNLENHSLWKLVQGSAFQGSWEIMEDETKSELELEDFLELDCLENGLWEPEEWINDAE
ncbi:hypothetical protein HGM15179_000561 [Zosterops borbonicus]|uniref:Uncharacterized protein n=1 Tax=Zosterops borbonicus TaxID=364589 RepID=A0A8K1LUL6_9PASS|nr:hypothetical protein HGM15179_000561 [Zosterops borbonicus]